MFRHAAPLARSASTREPSLLQSGGVRVRLDVRKGVAHTVPPGLPHQLPERLGDLVGVAQPEPW